MKKIIYTLFYFLFFSNFVFADDSIKTKLLNWVSKNGTVITNVANTNWKKSINSLFVYWKETIFWVLALIVIWVFLYLWFKIIMARWKPEELKKAFLMLIYTIIWLLIVSLSWVLVAFITGLKI